MVSKSNRSAEGTNKAENLYNTVTENFTKSEIGKQVTQSAEEIWHAGLGAFSKAQTEGRKVFDTLVKQGESLEQQSREVATSTLADFRLQAAKTLDMASSKFDMLEEIFESRVKQSLKRLGVMTSDDVAQLSKRVAELNVQVNNLLKQKSVGKKSPTNRGAVAKATQPKSKSVAKKSSAVSKPVLAKKIITKIHKKTSTSKHK